MPGPWDCRNPKADNRSARRLSRALLTHRSGHLKRQTRSVIKLSGVMPWNHRFRLITVLCALASLLFMQLAVAGYVCPGTGAKVAETAAMAEASMPCAEFMPVAMDEDQPNLCHAHCQTVGQSFQKDQSSQLVTMGVLPTTLAPRVAAPPLFGAPLQEPHLRRTIAPPLAIRNCCFRL